MIKAVQKCAIDLILGSLPSLGVRELGEMLLDFCNNRKGEKDKIEKSTTVY